MRRYLILLLLLLPTMLQAQGEFTFSPGIRVGYASGEKGGLTFGVDVSLMAHLGNGVSAGITFQKDHSRNDGWERVHIGPQVSIVTPNALSLSYGMEVGPTWITDERGTHLGVTTNGFVGAGLLPSLGATFYNGKVMMESGIYVKFPIPLYKIDLVH